MCTTTEETEVTTGTTETTDENQEVVSPRNINILLSLETYQGMTDEEIDMVFNYKINLALNAAEVQAKIDAENYRVAQIIANNAAATQRALDMIESLVNRGLPETQSVQPTTFTPQSIEV